MDIKALEADYCYNDVQSIKEALNYIYGVGGICAKRYIRDGIDSMLDNIVDHIKDVIFSGPCTIIIWDDGTKTMVRKKADEDDDRELAILHCIMLYLAGNRRQHYKKIISKLKTNGTNRASQRHAIKNTSGRKAND